MPKYDVWFTVRAPSGRTGLMETVSAKNKDAVSSEIRKTWYGELPEIKQVKTHKAKKG